MKTEKGTKKPAVTEDHYVYVIECSDGTLYTGYTTDVQRRVEQHNSGEGAKYTRGRTPVRLVYTEEFDNRGDAMSREAEIKKLSRDEKEKLVGIEELGVGDV